MSNKNLLPCSLRRYTTDDANLTFALFQRAVREVASRHYTPAQIEAWAGGIDPALWAATLERQSVWLAIMNGAPAGFASLADRGHLDMLFVSPAYQRCGVATALLTTVEETARRRGMRCLTTQASLSGLPFFKACGFDVVKAQTMKRCGQVLKNVQMKKNLKSSDPARV